jgi:hypothetical protein
VKGKVAGAAPGHPLETCRLVLISAERPERISGLGGEGTPSRLGKDGSFDFPGSLFSPGLYYLIVTCSPGMGTVLVRQRLVIGNQDPGDVVLNLHPLLELRGAVTIEGDKENNFSQPKDRNIPPGAATPQVSLYPKYGPLLSDLRAKVKDDGSFLITDIAPGQYRVRVFNVPPGAYLKSVKLDSGEARDAGIELNEVTARNPLQVTLSRSVGRIEGFVRTAAGEPAPFSVVTLVNDPPETGSGTSMMSGVGESTRFTLSPVAPGTYRLYAWEDLEVAQHYDPEFLKPYMSKGVQVTVSENDTRRLY